MEKPKIIAFYLPQFHVIDENNKWWGEGFTEWTNTKKAKALFHRHNQPKIPLNNYYYDLSKNETGQWQSELALKYGIDAFCYYHYWFNGKMLLEKPMESMLNNNEIKIDFCISWANEPWARTWDGKDKEVLMPQVYGGKKEWEKHLRYLLDFFRDKRYIKIDNKPLFLIYRTANIPNCEEMVEYWEERLKEEGFDGLYLVETMNSFQADASIKNSQAVVEFEPMLTIRHHLPLHMQGIRYIKKKFNILDKIDYSFIWKRVINRNKKYGKKRFLGAFVSWDNTARKGKSGLVLTKDSPEKFYNFFKDQYYKAIGNEDKFIFINAWNEWAEGTYLEPDEKNKYSYINAIKKVKCEANDE